MNLQKIEAEALHLSKGERTILLQKLLLSLDSPPAEELRKDWLAEAALRAQELDNHKVRAVPGHQVLEKARTLLK
ncbi:addiction module protein [Phytopseudomonas dryadis]|uniref:Addiction module antitoxin RelB n=1 Tax=Phytopseudomonas dryadis TaxID=2487520 RepID=A0ABY1Z484_9GAMM|nr:MULTISPECIES: addiction module protein [Pseudomonas]TBV04047.1 addiction module antitoxin RelB [Pseudomonas dryadis]TBV17061.1 addiction module antitoxin RelB [Pseudomonas sp. FRB 230]